MRKSKKSKKSQNRQVLRRREWNFAELQEIIEDTRVSVYEEITPTNLAQARQEFEVNLQMRRPKFRYEKLNEALSAKIDRNLKRLQEIHAVVQEGGAENVGKKQLSVAERMLLKMTWNDTWEANSLLRAIMDYREILPEEEAEEVDKTEERLERHFNQQTDLEEYEAEQVRRYYARQASFRRYEKYAPRVARRFYAIEKSRYGEPDEAIFGNLLRYEYQMICSMREDFRETMWYQEHCAKMAEELDGLLSEIPYVAEKIRVSRIVTLEELGLPELSVFHDFQELIFEKFEGIFEHIPWGCEKMSAEEVVDLLNKVLAKIYLGETGFRAKLTTAGKPVSVNQIERVIKIPREREFSVLDVQALILGHELGVHAMRGIPFEKCDFTALSRGLPGYLEFEEGLAKAVEQVLRNEQDVAGSENYLIIGLAHFCELDFRQIYEIIYRLHFLEYFQKDKDIIAQKEEARRFAFQRVMRCFRGTDELVNFKDLVYHQGMRKAWHFINDMIDEPEELRQNAFEMGKIDPMRSEHKCLVQEVMMV